MTTVLLSLTGVVLLLSGALQAALQRHAGRSANRLGFPDALPNRRAIVAVSSTLSLTLYAVALIWWQDALIAADVSLIETAWHVPAVLIVYDFAYYWLHRLMHARPVMRHVHGIHHRVRAPTVNDSLYTHGIETAAGNLLLLTVIVVVGPVSPAAFLIVLAAFSAIHLWAHAGFLLDRRGCGYLDRLALRHHRHHRERDVHFGVMLPTWDRAFGTRA